ncbi:MAG: agmatine deiminase family protein [Gammaproteobacteria bacterium]|nr:agmatine deiminase family protein [Gammaproteobacteria bacterium]
MPAEWEPHQATWLSWPHNRETWPGVFEHAEPVMARAVAALVAGETVRINVLDAGHEVRVRRCLELAGADIACVEFHAFPTNDAWCRDHGAIFVVRPSLRGDPLAAVDCGFNAWGGKYPPFDLDNAIPRRMAEALAIPRFTAGMTLEGGSIDANGDGTLLTTEQCLLNPNRNPAMSRADIETRLGELFGVRKLLWLGQGIAGDDTDGHVDDLARFVSRDTVVTVVEADPDDANFTPLRENVERLASMTLADGESLRVLELPMPAPVFHGGERLPASYANFYIANSVVLLPVYDDPADEIAAAVLRDCFPARRIVPIDCRKLTVGLGAFHCLTQQVPAV